MVKRRRRPEETVGTPNGRNGKCVTRRWILKAFAFGAMGIALPRAAHAKNEYEKVKIKLGGSEIEVEIKTMNDRFYVIPLKGIPNGRMESKKERDESIMAIAKAYLKLAERRLGELSEMEKDIVENAAANYIASCLVPNLGFICSGSQRKSYGEVFKAVHTGKKEFLRKYIERMNKRVIIFGDKARS